MSDLDQKIEETAAQPKQVTVDGVTVQAHPLPDLIKADKHISAKNASQSGKLPFVRFQRRSPGTT